MKQIVSRVWADIWKYKWVIIGFLIYYSISHFFWGAYCPMLLITGLPCPGCGMSRAIFFVLTMQFSRAWAMNPIAFLWVPLIFAFFLLRYFFGKSIKKLQPYLILVLFATILYYMYRMMLYFPSVSPMAYRNDNILASLFTGYEKIIRMIFRF